MRKEGGIPRCVLLQVLNRAHEREFGSIDEKNKPIWQVAEGGTSKSFFKLNVFCRSQRTGRRIRPMQRTISPFTPASMEDGTGPLRLIHLQ